MIMSCCWLEIHPVYTVLLREFNLIAFLLSNVPIKKALYTRVSFVSRCGRFSNWIDGLDAKIFDFAYDTYTLCTFVLFEVAWRGS